MDVPDGETNTTFIGAENGVVAKVCPHAPKDQKTGIVDTFSGHEGYTTAVRRAVFTKLLKAICSFAM